jgi:uncharacterized protein (TIGR04255 family)
MQNAPLIYTIAIVRFPRIPGIGKYTNVLLEAVRSAYPQFDEFTLSFVWANININLILNAKSEIDRGELKMLQFATPDRKWALLLTDEIFALHTSAYFDSENFVARFKDGLKAILNVTELRIEWMEAIGFRYLNLVKPRPCESLDAYFQTWALPPKPDIKSIDLLQGMYVAAYRTKFGDLRFQLLRKPPIVFPIDLHSPAVQKNGWMIPAPEGDFAVMDIDHGCHFSPLEPIDIDVIGDRILSLRSISRKLFDQAGTEHAKEIWNGETP